LISSSKTSSSFSSSKVSRRGGRYDPKEDNPGRPVPSPDTEPAVASKMGEIGSALITDAGRFNPPDRGSLKADVSQLYRCDISAREESGSPGMEYDRAFPVTAFTPGVPASSSCPPISPGVFSLPSASVTVLLPNLGISYLLHMSPAPEKSDRNAPPPPRTSHPDKPTSPTLFRLVRRLYVLISNVTPPESFEAIVAFVRLKARVCGGDITFWIEG
jgi:hypothetical protein